WVRLPCPPGARSRSSALRPESVAPPWSRRPFEGIAAAPRLGPGQPADDREAFAGPAPVVDSVNHAEVLGEQDMARIRAGQGTHHFDDARRTHRHLFPGDRVADDDIGEVRTVEPVTRRTFQIDGSDLLDHAVEVVDPGETGVAGEAAAELIVVDRPVDQLLPATAV